MKYKEEKKKKLIKNKRGCLYCKHNKGSDIGEWCDLIDIDTFDYTEDYYYKGYNYCPYYDKI